MGFAVVLCVYFRISASRRALSAAPALVWLGFMIALSFALPLFAIAFLLVDAYNTATSCEHNQNTALDSVTDGLVESKTLTTPATEARVSTVDIVLLVVSVALALVCLALMPVTRGTTFNVVLIAGHGVLLLPFMPFISTLTSFAAKLYSQHFGGARPLSSSGCYDSESSVTAKKFSLRKSAHGSIVLCALLCIIAAATTAMHWSSAVRALESPGYLLSQSILQSSSSKSATEKTLHLHS